MADWVPFVHAATTTADGVIPGYVSGSPNKFSSASLPTSIDGVSLTAGTSRVLVKDQPTAAQNGIYLVTSLTVWTQTSDYSVTSDAQVSVRVAPGATTYPVSANQNAHFILRDTSSYLWSRFVPTAQADLYTGADFGAQVNLAIQSLPITGGTVDMRGVTGAPTVTTQIVIDRPVRLQLGHVTLNLNTAVSGSPVPGFFLTKKTTSIGGTTTSPSAVLIEGLGRTATTLVAPLGQAIVQFDIGTSMSPVSWPNPFLGNGSAYFCMRRMTLQGNGTGSCVFDTTNLNTPNNTYDVFTEGVILIEENYIWGFDTPATGSGGGSKAALTFGPSVTFAKVRKNYFGGGVGGTNGAGNVGGCINLMSNADAHIEDNEFGVGYNLTAGADAAPSITVAGPDVHITGNIFARLSPADTGSQADILITPVQANAAFGGWIWITDNKFGGEGESLNPLRSRIQVASSIYVSAPTIIRANLFGGPAPFPISTIQLDHTTNTVTVTLTAAHGIPHGNVVSLGVYGVGPGAHGTIFNGTWQMTAAAAAFPKRLTYTLPGTFTSDDSGDVTGQPGVTLLSGAALSLNSPIDHWDISANFFASYGVLVADNQTLTAGNGRFGESLFTDNRVVAPYMSSGGEAGPWSAFANGGRQFTLVRMAGNAAVLPWDAVARDNETPELRNLLTASEDMMNTSYWVPENGATASVVSGSQTDPWGGTRAWKIYRDGTSSGQSVFQSFTPQQGQVVVKFWASATANSGTSQGPPSMVVGIFDPSANPPNGAWCGELKVFGLGAGWKEYKFVTTGLTAGHAYYLSFYPGNSDYAQATSIFLAGAQVSYFDSDYYPTTAASGALADATAGNRFERALDFGVGSSLRWPAAGAQVLIAEGYPPSTTILETTSGGATRLHGYTAGQGVGLYDGTTPVITAKIAGGAAKVQSDAASGAFELGWTGAPASGAGNPSRLVGQDGASAQASGRAALFSGVPGSGAADGGIGFFFAGVGTNDSVQLLGASTSAGRGTLQWSKLLTPLLQHAAPTTDTATIPFTVVAQAAKSGATTNKTGADLRMGGGAGTTTANNGHVDIQNPITTTTAPGAGGAGALPATPAGYLEIKINGTVQKLPYY